MLLLRVILCCGISIAIRWHSCDTFTRTCTRIAVNGKNVTAVFGQAAFLVLFCCFLIRKNITKCVLHSFWLVNWRTSRTCPRNTLSAAKSRQVLCVSEQQQLWGSRNNRRAANSKISFKLLMNENTTGVLGNSESKKLPATHCWTQAHSLHHKPIMDWSVPSTEYAGNTETQSICGAHR